MSLFALPRTVFAQEEAPPWLENLDCERNEQHYAGVEYCTGKEPFDNIHVIIVRLDRPGIKIEYVIAKGVNGGAATHECQDVNRSTKFLEEPRGPGCDDPADRSLYPVFSLEGAATDATARYPGQNVAVVINADYSACTVLNTRNCRYGIEYRDHGPEGLTVVRGNRLDGYYQGDGDNNAVNRPWLAISESAPLTAMIGKLLTDNGRLPENWMYTGVGGAPRLILDGDVVEWEIARCYHASGSCYPGASQTAVGLSEDGNWLFFVLAENHPTLLDLAQFMHDRLDIFQAIKFDGGGSSKLWYDGNTVVPGDSRLLTNYLAITAPHGEGIFPGEEPAPEPEPEPEPGQPPSTSWIDRLRDWWQGLVQSVENTWQSIQQGWQDFVQWLEDARQAIEDLQELSRNIRDPEWWVQQCCGSLLVPAGLVGLLWFRWRKMR